MRVTSRLMHSGGRTQVELVVSVKTEIYGAMNKALLQTCQKTLRQVFEQSLLNDLQKSNDTLKSVQSL